MGKHFAKKLQKHETHRRGEAKSGCVTKCAGSEFREGHHGSYRCNGYTSIKGDRARHRWYNVEKKVLHARASELGLSKAWFDRRLGKGRRNRKQVGDIFENPKAWHFPPRGDASNFHRDTNVPYAHNYHHILPWDALRETLKPQEAIALQKSQYNINDGINMIPLPCFDRVALVVGMYKHPNNHPKYNKEVKQAINDLKKDLRGESAKKGEHLTEEQVRMLKDVFEAWEKTMFLELMKEGAKAAAAARGDGEAVHVDEHQPSSMKQIAANLNKK